MPQHGSEYFRTAFGAEHGTENGRAGPEMTEERWSAFQYPPFPRTCPRIIPPALRPVIRRTLSESRLSKQKFGCCGTGWRIRKRTGTG
jgi:hypothetical protein